MLAEDTGTAAIDGALLRRLLRYLRPYWLQATLALVLLLASALVALVDPILTQRALDIAIPRRDLGLLTTLAALALGALLLEFVLAYVQSLLTTWIGQRVMRDLRLEIFAHLQRLGIPTSEAQGILDAYFVAFPAVKEFMERTVAEARERGYTETVFGRRRRIPELSSGQRNIRMAGSGRP